MMDGAGDRDPPSLQDFSRRLDAARGGAARESEDRRTAEDAERDRALGKGFRLASELLAPAVVGLGLGLGLDAVVGIAPWGLLAGLFLGFAAGLRNAVEAMRPGPARSGGDARVDGGAEKDEGEGR